MVTLLQDLRLAVRQLSRRPGFTATAVLTLALGMGVNAVAFGVVNGLLIKGFRNKVVEGVGRIATMPGGDESGYASLAELERFTDATRDTLDTAAEGRSSVAWRHDGIAETAWALFVSSSYFSMVNAPILAGQLHVARMENGGPASAVIGERFWRTKLGAASLARLTLRFNDMDVDVAGVIPESFTGPAGIYSPDVWLPLDDLTRFGTSPALQKRDTRWLFVMGRLKGGADAPQAAGQVAAAAAAMAREWPDTHKGRSAQFRMLGQRNSELRGLTVGASVGMAVIGVVLLLFCFNVASLLLARAVERERDMGIRSALGASPGRLMRLVVTEGFVLASLSGAVALVVAWWTQAIVSSFAIPLEEPQHIDLTPDGAVIGFLLALVCIAGVLPGLWPAVAASRVDVTRALASQGANAAGGRPSPLRKWLVGAQIAGSTAFIVLAALLIRSYGELSAADVGFARDQLVVVDVAPASNGYNADRARRYVDALMTRIRALPGVIDAAVIDHAPFFIGFDRQTIVWPEDAACDRDTCPKYPTYAVGPGYFRTMGIRLLEGREADADRDAAAVVVNQAFARKQWPDGGGVGKTLRLGVDGSASTVIGMTARTHTRGLDRESASLFVPIETSQFEGEVTVVVRTPSPLLAIRPIVETARAVDSAVALRSVKTMERRMDVQLWPFRTLSWMFSICGLLAIVLATVGLAGAVIHAVSRRMREFGVRVSLGATRRDLVIDVLRSSAALLAPGLAAGLLLAAGAAHVTGAVLVGVNALNPAVYAGVAALQIAIVMIACLWPAVRASRADPVVALRAE
jgi:putative ABC transport system permease protein